MYSPLICERLYKSDWKWVSDHIRLHRSRTNSPNTSSYLCLVPALVMEVSVFLQRTTKPFYPTNIHKLIMPLLYNYNSCSPKY